MQRAFEGKENDHSMFREKYREDAGSVIGSMQAYIVELLLYVLLIIPPAEVRPDPPDLEERRREFVQFAQDKLSVETNFWVTLVVLAGLGLIVSLSPGFFAAQFSRLKPLIETLQEEVSKAALNREGRMSSEEEKTGLASKAMADWVQMTWEHNESELDQVCVYRELAL